MYNDYVWNKDGTVKGKFDLMYKEIDDPWLHSKEKYGELSTALCLLNFLKSNNIKNLHSIGCGKGHYEKWIFNQLNKKISISGIDLSTTAIKYAKTNLPEGNFYTSDAIHDIKNAQNKNIKITEKLFLIRELFWYLGKDWIKIINQIPIKSNIAIELSFYSNQKYQIEVFNGPEDFMNKMRKSIKNFISVKSKVNKKGDYKIILIGEKYA